MKANKGYVPADGEVTSEERALLESVSVDGKFVDSPNGRIVNPGHSLEAAWFILAEGIITKNDEAIAAAKNIIEITLPLGIDKEHFGIIAFTDISGKPPVQLEWDMKLWWVHNEALIATLVAYKITGDEKYSAWYDKLHDYIFSHFSDPDGYLPAEASSDGVHLTREYYLVWSDYLKSHTITEVE